MVSKSIAKNYIYDLLYRILSIITPLVTAPYISRVIGAEGIGDYSYTQSICSYFTLFSILGSNIYGQREVAFCCDDKRKRSFIFWEIMSIRAVSIIMSSAAYLLVIYHARGELKILFLLQLVDILGLLFDITWLIQGVEEFGLLLYRNIFIKILSIISIFVFVKTQQDLYWYVLLTSLAVVAGNISLWPQIGKYVEFVAPKRLSFGRHLIPILSLFLPTIALRLYDAFDKTMLGMIVGSSAENGFYEQSLKIISISITVITSIGNVMSPRMAALYSQNNREKLNSYLYYSFEIVWILALPICFGIMSISGNLVPWFFGYGYDKVVVLLKYFSAICIAMGMKSVIGLQYLVPTQRQAEYTKSILAGLALNIFLNLFLIQAYQSTGAVMASVISEYFIILIQMFMIRKDIKIGLIFKNTFTKLISAGIMGAGVSIAGVMLDATFIHTCLLILLGCIIYIGTLAILRDATVWKIREVIFSKRKK